MTWARVEINLGDIDTDDLISELEDRGHAVHKPGDAPSGELMDSVDVNLGRVEHLLLCGQREQARSELIRLASNALGRPV